MSPAQTSGAATSLRGGGPAGFFAALAGDGRPGAAGGHEQAELVELLTGYRRQRQVGIGAMPGVELDPQARQTEASYQTDNAQMRRQQLAGITKVEAERPLLRHPRPAVAPELEAEIAGLQRVDPAAGETGAEPQQVEHHVGKW